MHDSSLLYTLLANLVLIVHFSFVLFVVAGLLLIVPGGILKWAWVRSFWLRLGHLAAIAFVVVESWLGFVCPLTDLELWLRKLAGQSVYDGDFIAYWLRHLMFFSAAPWVFAVFYSLFGALVIFVWLRFPPKSPYRNRQRNDAQPGAQRRSFQSRD